MSYDDYLFIYPCLGVHTDITKSLKRLPTGYNMATGKIIFLKL